MGFRFRPAGAGSFPAGLLAFLLSLSLLPSLAFAGGMPAGLEKKKEQVPAEVVEEPPAEAETPAEVEAEPPAPEVSEKGFPGKFTVGVRGGLSILGSERMFVPPLYRDGFQYWDLESTVRFKEGFNVGVLLGYAFENGLRFEAEGGYISNGFRKFDVSEPGNLLTRAGLSGSSPCVAGSAGCIAYRNLPESGQSSVDGSLMGETRLEGDLKALTLMMNAYYDLDFGSRFFPFVGAGLGVARFAADIKIADGLLDGTRFVDGTTANRNIYQVGGGLGYRIGGGEDGREVTLSIDYRYLDSFGDLNFREKITDDFVEIEFGGHYIGGGVRFGL